MICVKWRRKYIFAVFKFTFLVMMIQNIGVIGGGIARTSLTGVTVGVDVTAADKVWRCFQAIGDIAFAYAYSNVLIEIQVSLQTKCCFSTLTSTPIGLLVRISILLLFWSCGWVVDCFNFVREVEEIVKGNCREGGLPW